MMDLGYLRNFMNHICLYKIIIQKTHCFIRPPARLDVERNFAIFQCIKCFNVAPAQLCVSMSDYAFKVNYRRIVLDSYGR